VFASQWVWSLDRLTKSQLLVLLHLANRANDPALPHQVTGECNNAWPTVAGIAADCFMDRATVTRTLRQLRNRKLIFPIGYGGKSGRQVVYKLAGRSIRGGSKWLRWDPETERWITTDLAPGSRRDAGGPVVSPPIDFQKLKRELKT